MELGDLQKRQNRPYTFLYCSYCIFSGHLSLFPLKNKTSEELLLALKKSFNDFGCPASLLTDLEPALYSHVIRDFLKSKHVTLTHQKSVSSLRIKNGPVESCQRYLRRLIARYSEEHRISRFVDYLTQILKIFNEHVNRRTGFTPNQLRFDLDSIAAYQKRLELELASSKNKIDESKVLKIGTWVNVKELPRSVFSKEVEKRFSRQAYVIVDVKRSFPPCYSLFPKVIGQSRRFYENELYILPKDYSEKHSLPIPIEKILSKRDLRGGRSLYECALIGTEKRVFLTNDDIKNRFILFKNEYSEEIHNIPPVT